MPSPSAFLDAFHLSVGMVLGGYQLIDISIEETTISRYYHYRYPIVLTLSPMVGASRENMFRQLLPLLEAQPIAYGVRNPYRCWVEDLDNDDVVAEGQIIHIHLTGHAKRVRG